MDNVHATQASPLLRHYQDDRPSLERRPRASAITLDGGGVRGLVSLEVLRTIEEIIKVPLVTQVDLLAGTSTGAISAAALCAGYSPQETIQLFTQDASTIFLKPGFVGRVFDFIKTCGHLWDPEYPTRGVDLVAQKIFGNKTMGEAHTNLVVCTTNLLSQKPVLFTNYNNPQMLMATAVKASTAAPTYFKPYRYEGVLYGDGGLGLNNPAEVGYDELESKLPYNTLVKIFSVGTGNLNVDLNDKNIDDWGLANWGIDITDIMFNVQNNTVVDTMNKRMNECRRRGIFNHSFLRVQKDIPAKNYRLDNTTAINLEELRAFGRDMAAERSEEIRDFCRFIIPDFA